MVQAAGSRTYEGLANGQTVDMLAATGPSRVMVVISAYVSGSSPSGTVSLWYAAGAGATVFAGSSMHAARIS